jgi:hypothetical protein
MECAPLYTVSSILLGCQSIAKLCNFMVKETFSCCRGCRTCKELACIRAGPKADLIIYFLLQFAELIACHS